LLDDYPEISRWSMGFPDNWKESPLWKQKATDIMLGSR